MFRDMRRFKQQLSEEECENILREGKRGVLALSGDEGYPYAVPMDYVYDSGCLYFHSALQGHKIDAIRSCDKASFNVLGEPQAADDGWSYFFDSVTLFGRVRIITDEAQRTDKLRLLGNKYFPSEEMTENDIQKNAARCAVLELKIEHMTGKHVHER
ncbi:pyridoxamine 5'-phosphate oxidase family protein [Ruminococcus sp.]|uniref:pyridoxamine 5'-phosphate oxidase family protein n=1 Tax=Ruminococcus sp. TaxID=41978 RepID=UPI00387079D6